MSSPSRIPLLLTSEGRSRLLFQEVPAPLGLGHFPLTSIERIQESSIGKVPLEIQVLAVSLLLKVLPPRKPALATEIESVLKRSVDSSLPLLFLKLRHFMLALSHGLLLFGHQLVSTEFPQEPSHFIGLGVEL